MASLDHAVTAAIANMDAADASVVDVRGDKAGWDVAAGEGMAVEDVGEEAWVHHGADE